MAKINSFKDALNLLPQELYDLLSDDYDRLIVDTIIRGYALEKVTSMRINLLKITTIEVLNILKDKGIKVERTSFSNEVLIIKNSDLGTLRELEIYKEGKIYLQSLSSSIPPLILNPKKNTRILDMTAAPGGKTTEIASLTNNEADITALELDKIRFDKMVYNINLQGAKVNTINMDAKKMTYENEFDYILLDAPCSGSGTINLNDKKSYLSFSLKLVNHCASTQYELLKKAVEALKVGGTLVYSTCSILKKENEDNLIKLLNEYPSLSIIPIDYPWVKSLNTLPTNLKGTLTIAPNDKFEGFFIAKIRKK